MVDFVLNDSGIVASKATENSFFVDGLILDGDFAGTVHGAKNVGNTKAALFSNFTLLTFGEDLGVDHSNIFLFLSARADFANNDSLFDSRLGSGDPNSAL